LSLRGRRDHQHLRCPFCQLRTFRLPRWGSCVRRTRQGALVLQPRGPWAGTQPEDRLTSQQGRSRHDEDTERAPILSSRRPDTCGTLFRTVASHTNSVFGRTDLSTILTLDDELVFRQRGGQHTGIPGNLTLAPRPPDMTHPEPPSPGDYPAIVVV